MICDYVKSFCLFCFFMYHVCLQKYTLWIWRLTFLNWGNLHYLIISFLGSPWSFALESWIPCFFVPNMKYLMLFTLFAVVLLSFHLHFCIDFNTFISFSFSFSTKKHLFVDEILAYIFRNQKFLNTIFFGA